MTRSTRPRILEAWDRAREVRRAVGDTAASPERALVAFERAGLAVLLTALLAAAPAPADAQIRRHPTGVNVATFGATTVFITYGSLDGYVPVEATWCGEVVDAAPDIGQRCVAGTIFGHLPIRYDLSRASGDDALTDIMSIPPSVSRRAYQAASRGENSAFFYVRRFIDPTGAGPDQYVPVTCRLSGGGARVPFALLDVRLAFATDEPVLPLESGAPPPPLQAVIHYNGTGRLVGRWEVVLPGEEPPSSQDLLTEATLPVELRGTQRRYTEVGRFNVFVPPTGRVVLEGPDPDALPTDVKGLYRVLLRIEASDDREGDSSLDAVGAGTGLVHSGAVAGFPIPPLRYYVGAGTRSGTAAPLTPIEPAADASLAPDRPVAFSWAPRPGTAFYRIEVRGATGDEVLAALRRPGIAGYRAPAWLHDRVGDDPFTWRVLALDPDGGPIARSEWRTARFRPPRDP